MIFEKYSPVKEEMFQIIDEEGRVKAEEPELSDSQLREIFYYMLLTRVADEKAFKLQRQGRMGTFAPSQGHEAAQVGSAYALSEEDWMFPYFRDLGALLVRGLPLKNHYLYWMGHEEGMRIPENLRIFTINIPVASHLPHAVGFGMAAIIKGDRVGVVSYFGDGATSEGDFHEAMNFSGIFKTPNVFICINNQYAISVPRSRQTASKTLAQKALAYGFPGIVVDGNDVLAMYAATKEALERARHGKGPSLIEAYTYRLSHHTTSDDSSRYRSKEEVEYWQEREPLKRFRVYLHNKGIISEEEERELFEKVNGEVEKAVKEAEAQPLLEPEEIFKYTFAELSPLLQEQLDELKEFLREAEK